MTDRQWATLVVQVRGGGRSTILNSSDRGLFREGETYFNHQLRAFLPNSKLNVVIRLSPTGRRMVQGFLVKEASGNVKHG